MQTPKAPGSNRFEKALALAGLAVCLLVTFLFWGGIGSQQPMWPLPGGYFTELMLLAAVNAVLWVRDHPWRSFANLVTAAVFSVVMVLGVMTVGFFYSPVVLIFIVLAIYTGVRLRQNGWIALATYLVAAAAQTLLMLVVA